MKGVFIMSVARVHIRDDQWIKSESDVLPEDKQLCIVIFASGSKVPHIVQYRSPDHFCNCYQDGYFLDIEDGFNKEDRGESLDNWIPGFSSTRVIKIWRPLCLPKDDNERIQMKIEKWLM